MLSCTSAALTWIVQLEIIISSDTEKERDIVSIYSHTLYMRKRIQRKQKIA